MASQRAFEPTNLPNLSAMKKGTPEPVTLAGTDLASLGEWEAWCFGPEWSLG